MTKSVVASVLFLCMNNCLPILLSLSCINDLLKVCSRPDRSNNLSLKPFQFFSLFPPCRCTRGTSHGRDRHSRGWNATYPGQFISFVFIIFNFNKFIPSSPCLWKMSPALSVQHTNGSKCFCFSWLQVSMQYVPSHHDKDLFNGSSCSLETVLYLLTSIICRYLWKILIHRWVGTAHTKA